MISGGDLEFLAQTLTFSSLLVKTASSTNTIIFLNFLNLSSDLKATILSLF
jgi:hypothetical protein